MDKILCSRTVGGGASSSKNEVQRLYSWAFTSSYHNGTTNHSQAIRRSELSVGMDTNAIPFRLKLNLRILGDSW